MISLNFYVLLSNPRAVFGAVFTSFKLEVMLHKDADVWVGGL